VLKWRGKVEVFFAPKNYSVYSYMRISIFSDDEQIASSFSRFDFVEGPWHCSEWILENN